MPFLRKEFTESHERVHRADPLFKQTSSMVFPCICGSFGICLSLSPISHMKNLMAYLDDL